MRPPKFCRMRLAKKRDPTTAYFTCQLYFKTGPLNTSDSGRAPNLKAFSKLIRVVIISVSSGCQSLLNDKTLRSRLQKGPLVFGTASAEVDSSQQLFHTLLSRVDQAYTWQGRARAVGTDLSASTVLSHHGRSCTDSPIDGGKPRIDSGNVNP